jgi:hypothetical protein
MVMGSKPMWETSNKNKIFLQTYRTNKITHNCETMQSTKKTSSKCVIWSSVGVYSISCEEENNERMKEMGQPWTLA